jgi:hypothetical protein
LRAIVYLAAKFMSHLSSLNLIGLQEGVSQDVDLGIRAAYEESKESI